MSKKPFNPVVGIDSCSPEAMPEPVSLRKLHAAYLELKRRLQDLEAENAALQAALHMECSKHKPIWPTPWPKAPAPHPAAPYLGTGDALSVTYAAGVPTVGGFGT